MPNTDLNHHHSEPPSLFNTVVSISFISPNIHHHEFLLLSPSKITTLGFKRVHITWHLIGISLMPNTDLIHHHSQPTSPFNTVVPISFISPCTPQHPPPPPTHALSLNNHHPGVQTSIHHLSRNWNTTYKPVFIILINPAVVIMQPLRAK